MDPPSSHVEKEERTEKEAEGGETTGRQCVRGWTWDHCHQDVGKRADSDYH